MHESCCTMTTIAFVETKFVKITEKPRFIHPASKTRSIPYRLPLRSRTYSPSPDQYLRLRGGFRYFFAHSSVSIHRLSRFHTLLQSRKPSVVSSAPPTPTGAAAHDPSFFAPAPYSSLVRHAVAVRCTYPRTSPWRSEVLYEPRIYIPSLQVFVETLRPQVLRPTHLCALPETWFSLSGEHQPFVRLTSFQSTRCHLPGALTERNRPRRQGSAEVGEGVGQRVSGK